MSEIVEGPSCEKVDFVNVDLGDLVDLEVKVKVEKCEQDCVLQSCGSELTFVNVKTEPDNLSDDDKAEDPLTQAYTCEEPGCGKTFSDRFKLGRHRRSHNMCRLPGCAEAFASRKKLLMHEHRHLKQRSHPCPVPKCGKAFRAKADLKRHMKVLHKEKMGSFGRLCNQPSPPPLLDHSTEANQSPRSPDISPAKTKMDFDDPFCRDEVPHLKEKKLSWPGTDCGRKRSEKNNTNVVVKDGHERYLCGIGGCTVTYSHKYWLLKHRLKSHLTCPVDLCGKIFSVMGQVQSHLQKAHGHKHSHCELRLGGGNKEVVDLRLLGEEGGKCYHLTEGDKTMEEEGIEEEVPGK